MLKGNSYHSIVIILVRRRKKRKTDQKREKAVLQKKNYGGQFTLSEIGKRNHIMSTDVFVVVVLVFLLYFVSAVH